MNEEYRALRALKSVLNNRGLGINVNACLYKEVILPMGPSEKLQAWYRRFLRRDIDETPAKCPLYGRDKAVEQTWTQIFGLCIPMYILTYGYGLYIHMKPLLTGTNNSEGDYVCVLLSQLFPPINNYNICTVPGQFIRHTCLFSCNVRL